MHTGGGAAVLTVVRDEHIRRVGDGWLYGAVVQGFRLRNSNVWDRRVLLALAVLPGSDAAHEEPIGLVGGGARRRPAVRKRVAAVAR